jgi:hypothetical protein
MTERSPVPVRGFSGCLGYAALGLIALAALALLAALTALIDWAF